MYAQWRTIEDYQAMRNNPASSDHLQEARAVNPLGYADYWTTKLTANLTASAASYPISARLR